MKGVTEKMHVYAVTSYTKWEDHLQTSTKLSRMTRFPFRLDTRPLTI